MTKANDLKKEIAELTAKHKLQTSAEKRLKGFKILTFLFSYKKRGTEFNISVDLKDVKLSEIPAALKTITTAYKPTKNAVLSSASGPDVETASAYRLNFKNEIRENYVEIEYVSGKHQISIKLPIAFYSDDIKGVSMGAVTDCEYHYFGGVPMHKIRAMQLRVYSLDLFEKFKYFGRTVVNYIKDVEDKAEFEHVVLNGHTPEFTEFWHKQLNSL